MLFPIQEVKEIIELKDKIICELDQKLASEAAFRTLVEKENTDLKLKIEAQSKEIAKLKGIRIAVGEAWSPHRIMLNHASFSQDDWNRGQSMSILGWAHKMDFLAYPTKQPGTIRIAVGAAGIYWGPHRIMLNHPSFSQDEWNRGQSMSVLGWGHKMEFWVYPTEQPGTIHIAVGEAWSPHRIMMNHVEFSKDIRNRGQSKSLQGWVHKMDFWAYPL